MTPSLPRALGRPLATSLVTSLAMAALALPAAAQEGGSTAPAPARGATAFEPTRLSRIDAMVSRLLADRKIPGAVVMLVKDGEVVYHKAFGVRELGKPDALRTDDIFRIASQTKAITTLAAMMLWEEGKFQLDDPVGRYLPEFEKQTVLTKFNPADSSYESKPAKRRMTIRHLMTHSSGLNYADIGSDEFKAIYAKAGIHAIGKEGQLLADAMRKLGPLPLTHDPGERWTYGLNTDVLGRLVEVWSGMSLDEFFRKRIFEPLRMKDTHFEIPADKRTRLVALHQPVDGALRPMHEAVGFTHADFPARKQTYYSGGGGLASTTGDYARFLQLFLNKGELDGVRLVGRKTVELMLTNHVPSLGYPFGLGFALQTPENDYRSVESLGTFQWGGAFKTTYWADPKEQLIGQIYTNLWGSDPGMEDEFKTLVYSALR